MAPPNTPSARMTTPCSRACAHPSDPHSYLNHSFKRNTAHTLSLTVSDFFRTLSSFPAPSRLFHVPTKNMEFKYRAAQRGRTPSPPMRPLSTVTYVSDYLLRGCEFALASFPSNVRTSRVQTPVQVNAREAFRRELEKEQILRKLEKEEIRREIIANEMARRRELEEEVRREIAAERAFRIPLEIRFPERVLVPLNQNPRVNNPDSNINIFGGPQPQLPPQIDIRQQTNKDKIIILPKPDANSYGAKRKAVTPPVVDDSEHSGFSLQKKHKQRWTCALCQITATSEKGLNDHLQGKKHKAKEASLKTKKIGLDTRPNSKHFYLA